MRFDGFEQPQFDAIQIEGLEKINNLHKSFESKVVPIKGYFQRLNQNVGDNLAHWIGMDQVRGYEAGAAETIKQMYSGKEINGVRTLGLKEMSTWKLDSRSPFYLQNLKQQAGFAAEVISTAKENLLAQIKGTGVTTYRADDLPEQLRKKLPEIARKNDQYVDKVRVNAQGEIIERIQTKFVGKDGKECLNKLTSKKFDKYFNDGKVDKIEVSQENYDDIRKNNLIIDKVNSLEKQLQRVRDEGKGDTAARIEAKIDRYKKIDEMIERSTVSQREATYARRHGERYVKKLFAQDTVMAGHEAGKESGLSAAGITAAVSTVDNLQKVWNGEIELSDAVFDIAKDAGTAGALGYGTEFISGAVARTMSQSGYTLIKSLGKANIPAAVISVGVDSFDSVSDFAQGIIDAKELVYDLGESAAGVAGSIGGAALAGAALGSVVPGAGTAAGFAAGLVGGMVGCAVTTEAYQTAVELGTEGVEILADKAQKLANGAVELVEKHIPEKVNEIKDAFQNFFDENKLPFSV